MELADQVGAWTPTPCISLTSFFSSSSSTTGVYRGFLFPLLPPGLLPWPIVCLSALGFRPDKVEGNPEVPLPSGPTQPAPLMLPLWLPQACLGYHSRRILHPQRRTCFCLTAKDCVQGTWKKLKGRGGNFDHFFAPLKNFPSLSQMHRDGGKRGAEA